jgi:hypothetical protein
MAATLKYIQETDPFWVFNADVGACAFCDPGSAMDDDGFWRCSHMQRLVVDEYPSLDHYHDGRVCPGNCRVHPLVDATGPMRIYQNATLMGVLWGDIMMAELDAVREKETPAQRIARLARETLEREASRVVQEKAQVAYHVQKCASVYCDRSGALKTVWKMCKWDDTPAVGAWPAGCAAHHKGACGYVHKNQPALLAEFLAGSRPSSAGSASSSGRDFSGLSSSRPSSGGRPPVHQAPPRSAGGGGRSATGGSNRSAAGGGGARSYPSGGDGSAW